MKKKIEYYGTLGPACANEETLTAMFEAGMTGIRLNLSHKSLPESREWVDLYRNTAKKCGKNADLLIDLIGPEIRIGDVKEERILIEETEIILGENGVPVPSYIEEILVKGQHLLVDDGKIELVVTDNSQHTKGTGPILCKILRGGTLKSRKSLALPEMTVKNPTLTEADYQNLKVAKEYGVTAVMLPFVRGKEDLINLKNVLKEYGSEEIRIFAKIENMEGVEKLYELLPYCDHIVIARGDLGNAVPLTKLPVIQQKISDICNEEGMPFMVVTQMLNSMMESAVPTRAEVTDIFHAIREGASSVMLTGETAAGQYPVEAMRVLVDTGEAAFSWKMGIYN